MIHFPTQRLHGMLRDEKLGEMLGWVLFLGRHNVSGPCRRQDWEACWCQRGRMNFLLLIKTPNYPSDKSGKLNPGMPHKRKGA
jgi:hypothetical protein